MTNTVTLVKTEMAETSTIPASVLKRTRRGKHQNRQNTARDGEIIWAALEAHAEMLAAQRRYDRVWFRRLARLVRRIARRLVLA